MSCITQLDQMAIKNLLRKWLARQIDAKSLTWLAEKQNQIAQNGLARVFFTAFSAVPRYTGKQDLSLTPKDLEVIKQIRKNWFPVNWTVDQAARTLLVLSLPQDNSTNFLQILEQVFTAADVGELVTLYQALPLLPYPEHLKKRAAEGVRSNMTAVFNAIAFHNPYPAEYFDDLAWNQMILKALFVGSPLHLIFGLEQRSNPELARMLVDYVHERWAANRSFSPQLWRLVGKFATPDMLPDLEKVLSASDPGEKAAAALACADCSLPQAQDLLKQYPDFFAAIKSGNLTWKNIDN
jgi:hypothetical protein